MANERTWEAVDSLIGPGCLVEGVVVFRGGLRVDGTIAGGVQAAAGTGGSLLLSAQGRIEGEVRATDLTIGGEVIGDLHAAGRVELLPRARIIGNIHYACLAIQAGACVTGKLSHLSPQPHQAVAPAAARSSGYNPGPLIHTAGALT